jgi:formylglycine-generating enzyme required for sulfatase activity
LHANPLFFTLLAALWLAHPERRLPATQAELYRAAVDLMLDRWTRRRTPELSVADNLGVTPTQLRQVLETLACTVHEQRQAGEDTTAFPIGQLLEIFEEGNFNVRVKDVRHYLERHAGLLVAPEPRRFRFSHRSFQEHLAACALTCREPAQCRPPLALDRHFPQGLLRRVQEQPALWENVALLAADELLVQGREYELWSFLHGLCQPYAQTETGARSAFLTLKIAQRHNFFAEIGKGDLRYAFLEPLRQAALRLLTDHHTFPTPAERDLAGTLLGQRPEHDTRKGVGCRLDGLPDLDWVEIPEMDAQGRREFIYQKDERRVEPTFWLARYPITYGQFQAFVDAEDGFANSRWWKGLSAPKAEQAAPGEQSFKFWNHPRDNVSWVDAMAFCRWLTAKAQAQPVLLPPALQGQSNWRITLPTEWQWEKAARGHDGRQYPWGEKYQIGYANINETYQQAGPHYLQKTSAVGMYPHGASLYGLLDMSGNVWERCLNEYRNPDRTQAEGDADRVVRGRSWRSYSSPSASALCRSDLWSHRHYYSGFRVAVGFVGPVS